VRSPLSMPILSKKWSLKTLSCGKQAKIQLKNGKPKGGDAAIP